LNHTYYEADVGFAAPDYWVADGLSQSNGSHSVHTFEADCFSLLHEGFKENKANTEIHEDHDDMKQ
jgi:hypothetical protein